MQRLSFEAALSLPIQSDAIQCAKVVHERACPQAAFIPTEARSLSARHYAHLRDDGWGNGLTTTHRILEGAERVALVHRKPDPLTRALGATKSQAGAMKPARLS